MIINFQEMSEEDLVKFWNRQADLIYGCTMMLLKPDVKEYGIFGYFYRLKLCAADNMEQAWNELVRRHGH